MKNGSRTLTPAAIEAAEAMREQIAVNLDALAKGESPMGLGQVYEAVARQVRTTPVPTVPAVEVVATPVASAPGEERCSRCNLAPPCPHQEATGR